MRRFSALVLLATSIAIGGWLWWSSRATAPESLGRFELDRRTRPIVLVTVDTTRADHLAPYGATDIATPTLSRLAAEGLTFENAWSVAPITLVAHSSILSGTYPFDHGVRNNGIHALPSGVPTIASVLRDHGWPTAAFVSAAVLDHRYGLADSFDVYDDDLSSGRERRPRMVPDRPAEATVAAARAWLDGLEGDEPFFLWVHFYDPHAPYSPPAPYRDRYRERLYDGEIAYLDAQLHELFEHPRLAADQAILALIGDHGESLGEHGEQTHAILAYDSTLHVPFFLRAPGLPAGGRVGASVSQVDVAPTLLDLVGVTGLPEVAGRSLVPLLEGGAARERHFYGETYLPFYTYGWAKLRSLRSGRWKYIDAPTPELYDLRRDPRETVNLFEQEPGIAHDLARDLAELVPSGSDDRETRLALDSDAIEQLRALGYVSVSSTPAVDGERADPKDMIGTHVRLERARSLSQEQMWDAAVTELRGILVEDPGNLAALGDLAEALRASGRIEEAVSAAEAVLARDPGSPRSLVLLARLEQARGQSDRALELLDLALAADAKLSEAILTKAHLLSSMARGKEAETLLAAARESNPTPRLDLAWAQLVEIPAGRLDEAQALVERALGVDPFLALGWRLLGSIHASAARNQDAIEAWTKGLERAPDDAELHGRLGTLLASIGGGREAEIHLREAIRLADKPRPDLRVALGGWLADHGEPSAAQQEFDRVLADDPHHPSALNNRALALLRLGRIKEAEPILRDLVERYPRHADALNNLAAIEINRERWPQAEELARRSLALQADEPEALNNLGVALDEQGQHEAAAAQFERALAVAPAYWQAKLNLGMARLASGDADRGIALLEELVTAMPSLGEAHYQLGMALAARGDAAGAKRHLNTFLKAAPSGPAADLARAQLHQL